MIDHLYHPARLNFPLKRTGERGANKWQALSWDQALDEVAGRLAMLRTSHGPETLAFTHGTHRTYHWDGRRFFNGFGSPNLCGANGGLVTGECAETRCLVVAGSAPSQSDPLLGFPEVVAARKRGVKLIVVDPRRTRAGPARRNWQICGFRSGESARCYATIKPAVVTWGFGLDKQGVNAGVMFQRLLEQNGVFGRREYRRFELFGFGTPSGKVELRSSIFEALGCEPIPVYREPAQSPSGDSGLTRDYLLVLITGRRFMPMYHPEQRQLAAARLRRHDPQSRCSRGRLRLWDWRRAPGCW